MSETGKKKRYKCDISLYIREHEVALKRSAGNNLVSDQAFQGGKLTKDISLTLRTVDMGLSNQ